MKSKKPFKKAKTKKRAKPLKAPRFVNLFVPKKERDFLTEHLAMMLSSGMDVLMAVDALIKDARSGYLRKVLKYVKQEINEGSELWKSFDKVKLLPPQVISLIRIGEQAGKLSENLQVIVVQEQKERIFRSKLRSAMMYPVFVLVLAAVIGIGIAWFILPRLATVFSSLRMDLPDITKVLIKLGEFLGESGATVLPIFTGAIFLLFYFVFLFPKTKAVGQWFLMHTPGVKGIIVQVHVARFGYVLGTLLEAGLPVLDALDAVSRATTYHSYKRFYESIKTQVGDGHSFRECFETYKKSKKAFSNYSSGDGGSW